MRRFRFAGCSVFFILIFNLCAENKMGEERSEKSVNDSIGEVGKALKGSYCGLGLDFGIQKTTSSVNREFSDRSESVNSTVYGGTVTFGYHHVVYSNCFVGVEVGVDFGSQSKQMQTGGVLKAGSNYVQREFLMRNVLRQMMLEAFNAFDARVDVGNLGTYNRVIHTSVWNNFVSVVRYIGGENIDISAAHLANFITNPADPAGVSPARIGNMNATLRNFMGNVMTTITQLGREQLHSGNNNQNLLAGLGIIREFVTSRYETFAMALRHIADADLRDINGALIGGTHFGGNVNLNDHAAYMVTNFLRNSWDAIDVDDLGINPATVNENELNAIMNSIYIPTAEDDALLALPRGVNPATIKNNVKTKSTFGVCPHIAFKMGYFFKELGASLYVKTGMIQLNGRVTPVNDLYDLQDEKFNKIAPFVAFGCMKNIDGKWGVAVEVSHAFRVTKKMQDVKIFRQVIENKTSISRTNVRIMATYSF
ncbi:MAG: hypothetical protein LBB21_00170 [Holosporaceae bacterium]|nr:hypothetical protein [Holosporaceae bacterium]